MSDFIWVNGHLGWGLFILVVFTGLWWLLSDVLWRLQNTAVARLAAGMLAGWTLGVGLLMLVLVLGNL